jgi:hypothetical protein
MIPTYLIETVLYKRGGYNVLLIKDGYFFYGKGHWKQFLMQRQ